jgi:hypothetical protein
MDDEGESSAAGLRHTTSNAEEHAELDNETVDADEEARMKETIARERRLDAKRKRIALLDQLLRELDTLTLLELITIYHLEYVFTGVVVDFDWEECANHPAIAALFFGLSYGPSSM